MSESDTERYRRLAAEARVQSAAAVDVEAKDAWAKMAEEWSALARSREYRIGTPGAPAA
jgi:hypothetical protein